jgi:AraC-like DNA-binding protein
MDRHDIPKEITAEHVAQMHQEDLKVQHLFGCKGMTYWCDEDRKTAFCLIEAPNKVALQEMHNYAHGDVPNSIIEVNKKLVASFLGRIEDPEKQQDTELNIINDSAFRVIMVIETSNYFHRFETQQFGVFTQKFHNSVTKTVTQFNGSIAKRNNNFHLVSFKSVSNAILCALKIQDQFKSITAHLDPSIPRLKIGISSGSPVTDKGELFEETITLAKRLCETINDQVVISSEVKALYESENGNTSINKELIRALKPDDEKSLTQLMDFIERIWSKPDFNVDDFSKALGHSKSQLYRKLINLTGKSPNNFLKEFRLRKALDLLHDQKGNISEIAFETGFNSPAYFSKCFRNKFGFLPSEYIQQYIA